MREAIQSKEQWKERLDNEISLGISIDLSFQHCHISHGVAIELSVQHLNCHSGSVTLVVEYLWHSSM